MSYSAKLLNFEGPLDLLLQLIESSKLAITEVNLSSVTNQYLSYIEAIKTPKPTELHSFLSLASRLIYLKSVALLPSLATPEGDEELTELAEQLENYKHYIAAAAYLQDQIAGSRRNWARPAGDKLPTQRLPLPKLDLDSLAVILQEELRQQQARLPQTVRSEQAEQMSLEDACMQIASHVASGQKHKVRDIFGSAPDRTTALVLFLAILELIKQGQLIATQLAAHQEIVIYHATANAATIN